MIETDLFLLGVLGLLLGIASFVGAAYTDITAENRRVELERIECESKGGILLELYRADNVCTAPDSVINLKGN